MGTILEFPANAATRPAAARGIAAEQTMGQLVILPVVRIERHSDEASGDHGPEEGAASGRRRRRRARS